MKKWVIGFITTPTNTAMTTVPMPTPRSMPSVPSSVQNTSLPRKKMSERMQAMSTTETSKTILQVDTFKPVRLESATVTPSPGMLMRPPSRYKKMPQAMTTVLAAMSKIFSHTACSAGKNRPNRALVPSTRKPNRVELTS